MESKLADPNLGELTPQPRPVSLPNGETENRENQGGDVST